MDPCRLLIWGPTDSGKTLYLTALIYALDKYHLNYTFKGKNDTSKAFVEQCQRHFATNTFPKPTADGLKIYQFQLGPKVTSPNDVSIEIVVLDGPGRFIVPETIHHDEANKYLLDCDGAILMIDPLNGPNEYRKYIHAFIRKAALQRSLRLSLCLTKIDRRNEDWEKFAHGKQSATDPLRKIFDSYADPLTTCVDVVQYHAVSSLGRVKIEGSNQSIPNILEQPQGRKTLRDGHNWRPFGIFRPLQDLLQAKQVPSWWSTFCAETDKLFWQHVI